MHRSIKDQRASALRCVAIGQHVGTSGHDRRMHNKWWISDGLIEHKQTEKTKVALFSDLFNINKEKNALFCKAK